MRTTFRISLSAVVATLSASACGGSETPPPEYAAVESATPPPTPETTTTVERDEPIAPPAAPPVQVVMAESTPIEGSMPTLAIQAPRAGQRIRPPAKVMVRAQLRNWTLAPEPGSHVHLVFDDHPYIAIRDVSKPLDLGKLLQENFGEELSEGTHVIRMFPSRQQHESVKEPGAFAVTMFHYGSPTEGFEFDPSAPLLTYSRPKGCNPAGQRILLDFFVANTTFGEQGHHVRYEIDDAVRGDIMTWAPHYIENLPIGAHRVTLTLVDASGNEAPGPFNRASQEISVAESCPPPPPSPTAAGRNAAPASPAEPAAGTAPAGAGSAAPADGGTSNGG